MRHRSAARLAGCALGVMTAFVMLPSAAANAAALPDLQDIVGADGKVNADVAEQLGIDPQTVSSEVLDNGATLVTTFVPDGSPIDVQSSHGCNKSVCITLKGKGLKVDYWESTARTGSRMCTRPYFWEGVRVFWTPHDAVCGNGPGTFIAWYKNPGSFPHNTQLCNTWIAQQIPGRPCERVLR